MARKRTPGPDSGAPEKASVSEGPVFEVHGKTTRKTKELQSAIIDELIRRGGGQMPPGAEKATVKLHDGGPQKEAFTLKGDKVVVNTALEGAAGLAVELILRRAAQEAKKPVDVEEKLRRGQEEIRAEVELGTKRVVDESGSNEDVAHARVAGETALARGSEAATRARADAGRALTPETGSMEASSPDLAEQRLSPEVRPGLPDTPEVQEADANLEAWRGKYAESWRNMRAVYKKLPPSFREQFEEKIYVALEETGVRPGDFEIIIGARNEQGAEGQREADPEALQRHRDFLDKMTENGLGRQQADLVYLAVASRQDYRQAKFELGQKILEAKRTEISATGAANVEDQLRIYQAGELREILIDEEQALCERLGINSSPRKDGAFRKILQWYGSRKWYTRALYSALVGAVVAVGTAAFIPAVAASLTGASLMRRGVRTFTAAGFMAGVGSGIVSSASEVLTNRVGRSQEEKYALEARERMSEEFSLESLSAAEDAADKVLQAKMKRARAKAGLTLGMSIGVGFAVGMSVTGVWDQLAGGGASAAAESASGAWTEGAGGNEPEVSEPGAPETEPTAPGPEAVLEGHDLNAIARGVLAGSGVEWNETIGSRTIEDLLASDSAGDETLQRHLDALGRQGGLPPISEMPQDMQDMTLEDYVRAALPKIMEGAGEKGVGLNDQGWGNAIRAAIRSNVENAGESALPAEPSVVPEASPETAPESGGEEAGQKAAAETEPVGAEVINVERGDNLWNIMGKLLKDKGLVTDDTPAAERNFMIADKIQEIRSMSNSDFDKLGFQSRNLDLIYPDDRLDLSSLFEDRNELDQMAERAHEVVSRISAEDAAAPEGAPTPTPTAVEAADVPAEGAAAAAENAAVEAAAEGASRAVEATPVSWGHILRLWESRYPGGPPDWLLDQLKEMEASGTPFEEHSLFREELGARIETLSGFGLVFPAKFS